jgi:hypothetical protein
MRETTEVTPFIGLWQTSFGRLRLVGTPQHIEGIYAGVATLTGKVKQGKLHFRYQEPNASGEGWFALDASGNALSGAWREKGGGTWREWKGVRVEPTAGRAYLVVLEANWENNIEDHEYAFGNMLRAYFARSPQVEVRHRWFTDEKSLQRWAHEAALIAEPVVVVIASHGDEHGIAVGGRSIGADAIAQAFRFSSNALLLHFSACLLMKERLGQDFLNRLGSGVSIPVSGYATTVDWAQSAVIEFVYLDLILVRGLSAQDAYQQTLKMMPIAGEETLPNAILPAARLRIISADGAPATSG